MKIKMLNNLIGVERKDKASKKSTESFLAVPDSVDSLGIIKYLGETYEGPLKVGDQVYFGGNRERIRMSSADIEVMSPENIVAIIEDLDEKDSKKS